MKIINTKTNLKNYVLKIKQEDKKIGLVPTMGALHEGHLSLIKKSVEQNNITVVSIFINPTQFDNKEDLDKYPVTIKQDLRLLKSVNCNAVFIPLANDIYDGNITSTNFDFDGVENQMEGKFRNGHFNGVATIVKKLFELAKPNNAYFGEKDFQQLLIIKKLVKKNNIPVKINGLPIFRELDGLAMSSRNTRLTAEQRKAAPFIFKTLTKAKELFPKNGIKIVDWVKDEFKNHPLLSLEYFTVANEKNLVEPKKISKLEKYRGFIAVYAGKVRLIDNIDLN